MRKKNMNFRKIIKENIKNILEAEIPGYGEVPDDLHLNDYDERQKAKEMKSDSGLKATW